MRGIRDMNTEHPIVKASLDVLAGVTVAASVVGWMPMIALGIAIIYHSIQIWETDTIREWTGRRPKPRHRRHSEVD